MPRIVRVTNSGLGCFGIGKRDTLCDWVYVDNLTHGITLAATKLLTLQSPSPLSSAAKPASVDASGTAPAGRAYAISDDFPVNNFDWVARMLGQSPSSMYVVFLPSFLLYAFAILCEAMYRVAFTFGACLYWKQR